jgi:hypothetical protein
MMKHSIYTIKDSGTGVFGKFLQHQHESGLTRELKMLVNNNKEGNLYYHFPSQFDLYQIGTFDDDTGEMMVLQPMMHVLNFANLKFVDNEK